MGIQIETGVRIPVYQHKVNPRRAEIRDAIKAMQVGDSFEVSGTYEQQTAYEAARVLNVVITVRQLGKGKRRIWRLQ